MFRHVSLWEAIHIKLEHHLQPFQQEVIISTLMCLLFSVPFGDYSTWAGLGKNQPYHRNTEKWQPAFLIKTGTLWTSCWRLQAWLYKMTFMTLKIQKLTESGWKPVSSMFEYWLNGNRTLTVWCLLFSKYPTYFRQASASMKANESRLPSILLNSPRCLVTSSSRTTSSGQICAKCNYFKHNSIYSQGGLLLPMRT